MSNIRKQFVKVMRESYTSYINEVLNEINMSPYAGQEDEDPVVSSGLKVRHKKSNFLYTVDSISLHGVELVTPEGEKISVDKDTFEKEYELD